MVKVFEIVLRAFFGNMPVIESVLSLSLRAGPVLKTMQKTVLGFIRVDSGRFK